MGERLHDARAETRVTFTEGETTTEFLARYGATKFKPMVVTFSRNQGDGARFNLDSCGSLEVRRRQVPRLPLEFETTIDTWLDAKRSQMAEAASKALEDGAVFIKVTKSGEVLPT